MDISTNVVLLIAVFALVVIVGLMISRRVRARIKGPLGSGLEIETSKEPVSPSPAVKVSEAKSRSGGVAARDETGRGVEVSKAEAGRDVIATNVPPKPGPKA
jgi:hypothetical protein